MGGQERVRGNQPPRYISRTVNYVATHFILLTTMGDWLHKVLLSVRTTNFSPILHMCMLYSIASVSFYSQICCRLWPLKKQKSNTTTNLNYRTQISNPTYNATIKSSKQMLSKYAWKCTREQYHSRIYYVFYYLKSQITKKRKND